MSEGTTSGLSSEEKVALFNELERAQMEKDDAEARAKNALAEATGLLSEVCKKIVEHCGKGPFEYKGKRFSLMNRKGGSYFLRGPRTAKPKPPKDPEVIA